MALKAWTVIGRKCIEIWGEGASKRKPKATLQGHQPMRSPIFFFSTGSAHNERKRCFLGKIQGFRQVSSKAHPVWMNRH